MTVFDGPPWVCVSHSEFEGPGLFAEVAGEHGVELRGVATDRGERVPDLEEVAGVIVLGGDLSVAQIDAREHLARERDLLGGAARAGLPVMGVCLGSQLLASGLGASVEPMSNRERGMHEVTVTAAGAADPVLGPEAPGLRAFQLHDDAFSLPAGAVGLATSPGCPEQAFRFGTRAYGLQFHLDLSDPFAAFVPEEVRPTRTERAALADLGRRIVERFFAVAVAGPTPEGR